MVETIRAFIAIELPEDTRAYLGRLEESLKSGCAECAKWVIPDNIHLTLKFLGNVDIQKVERIKAAMEVVASSADSFDIQLKGLGAFPNLRRVQVVWVGITGGIGQIRALRTGLDVELEKHGFAREVREFVPHLTLARMRDNATNAERQNLGEAIDQTELEVTSAVRVTSISLIESQLTPRGAIYTKMYSADLRA